MRLLARVISDEIEVEIDTYEVLSEMLRDINEENKHAVLCSVNSMYSILKKIPDEMIASFSQESRNNIYRGMMEHVKRWKPDELLEGQN